MGPLTMHPVSETPAEIEFGRFRVFPHRREFLADGRPLELGGRAFDVLMALIEASGAVVSKDALIERVWPNRIVEENNLQVQISALRKAFSADRDLIRTIAGRGYQFTGVIRTVPASPDAAPVATMPGPIPAPARAPTNLPEPVAELIGRDVELEEILRLAASHRLVTLAGAGGIGKTRLGIEIARRLRPRFADGVWIAELAPLSDPGLVPVTVATAAGIEVPGGAASAERVANALGPKQLMVVLDNCEHVVDAAAQMAEALLRANSAARVIATSREPLRVEGEWIFRVPPLAVPTEASPDSEDPLRYGAVRLFVERARGVEPHFSPDGRVAATIAAICRRLDGIPLAIELAAARASALGIEELAARLDDRFDLLTSGRRTALARQRTLRATLDWSYDLLVESERLILRRLAVFPASFTLTAARAVVASVEIAAADVDDRIAHLVSKSLVTADVSGPVARYRLLDTTRAFAREKLAESGELAAAARLHAVHYREFLERAATRWATTPTSEWLAAYALEIDNVRAALDWAFAPGGDASIGSALAAASAPLWIQLSLLEECRARAGQALAWLEAECGRGTRQEMLLQAALAVSFLHTNAPARQTAAAWTSVLNLAEELKDAEYQLRALYGLWVSSVDKGGYPAALALAHRFLTVAEAKADASGILVGDRLVGVSLHFLGDQTGARRRIEHMLARYDPAPHRSSAVRFGLDQRVGALNHLARILWVQGFPDQAMRTAQAGVAQARMGGHTNSLCLVLADGAVPVAIMTGDLAIAEQLVAQLIDLAERHGLGLWHACGRGLRGWMIAQRGDAEEAVSLLHTAVEDIGEGAVGVRYAMFLGWLAEALGGTGRAEEGISAIDEALRRSERNEERWCFPELLRIQGELMLLTKEPSVAAAEANFLQALSWGRRHGALSWELRGAISLARLRRKQGRTEEARMLLAAIYDRFTEGFATADLERAKALIDATFRAPDRAMTGKADQSAGRFRDR